MGENNKNNNLQEHPVTRWFRNAVLGATMADLPAMMTASGWRLNEKGDYVLDLQNDPHVKLLRDNLAAEGAGVMLGEFGLPAIWGMTKLGTKGINRIGNKTINYFKDKYGKEVIPTPYPGPDSDLVDAVNDALLAVLRDYFSSDKTNQIKKTMNWGDLEISELLDEILRTIGNGSEVLIKGPKDGFTIIGEHEGKLYGTGADAEASHLVTLNRERIPDLLTAQEAGIHELGVHGKTASMQPEDFGKGGYSDNVKTMFPRLAEITLKNKELADALLVLNKRGLFLDLFKNVGDLEKYFVNKGLSWEDKWDKFYNNFKYYKYTTKADEKTARAYTGQLFNKVFDPNKKTLNIELLERFYTPESVEAFKKAVLGVAPVATATSLIPSDKKGSKILIKKKNRGKFTEYCGGEVTDECILKAKKSKNPKLRKRATFALNARKWKHEEGAKIHKPNGHKSILDNGWMKDRKVAKGSGGTFPGFWDDAVMYSPEIAEGNPALEEINKRNYVGDVKKLPYAQTVLFIRNLENPKEKGIKNGVARAYDSRTAGYGTDFVSGHPELAAKIKSGKWTTLEAKDLAVIDMRNHDRVIMENLQQYTTRPDTVSPGPRLLAALARYHYGNIRKDFDEWGRAIANGDAETQKKLALKLSKGYDDRNLKILEFDIYGL